MDQVEHRPDSGVLTGVEIAACLNELMKFGSGECVESCSYDMRVGTIFRGSDRISHESSHDSKVIQILPGEFVYIYTMEELTLGYDMIATAYAMNSLSSKGLLVINPGHVDPGFRGPLTVTAWNLNNKPQAIEVGDKMITVLFNRLSENANPFSRNKSRVDRERAFTKHVSTEASIGIAQLIEKNSASQLVTNADLEAVKREISNSPLNWISLIIAIVGLIIAILSVFSSDAQVVQQFPASSAILNQPSRPTFNENSSDGSGPIQPAITPEPTIRNPLP
ncbi:dCTP deaminase domain-containing protein [Planctomicrobium piriforme]|uniref:Deoxycytidine triphosphate deaminase n=1 Tax=Planctomicrobium piriforme TaxID=1576369 RepID=A0A1I3NDT8_9PLAN|nr:hypothetical protein [Planctomicrobium piriforme]SFJ07498.1 deoxycytidine triphosphate deaminase [Planctomicrobium piriforme]